MASKSRKTERVAKALQEFADLTGNTEPPAEYEELIADYFTNPAVEFDDESDTESEQDDDNVEQDDEVQSMEISDSDDETTENASIADETLPQIHDLGGFQFPDERQEVPIVDDFVDQQKTEVARFKCSCKFLQGEPCYKRIPPETFVNHRLDMLALNRGRIRFLLFCLLSL